MWYLMSAYALTGKKRAPITEVFKHWDEGTVFVVTTGSGKKMFASSCCTEDNYTVGSKVVWTKDTGFGHVKPSWDNCELTIENIIVHGKCLVTGEHTIVKKENNVGLDDSRPIYVFK